MCSKSAEDQHTARGTIGGYVYQFYCFLYHLLTMEKGSEVSFEKLDDTAIETENYITLYQAKHTIQISVDRKEPLTDRSPDLWKAIDVWCDLIKGKTEEKRTEDDMLKYIECHKFVFYSNRDLKNNKFVQLCNEVKEGNGKEKIDDVLDEITQKGRPRKVKDVQKIQAIIDNFKQFALKREFLKQISFQSRSQDEIFKECIEHIVNGMMYSEENAEKVFNDFLVEVINDFSANANKGISLSYTYEKRHQRFERVFQYHREEKLDFRINPIQFKKELLDLTWIRQLESVKDLAKNETSKIAKYASYFYGFKNTYDQIKEESKLLDTEDKSFREDAIAIWDIEFNRAYGKLDESATDDEIVEKATDILYKLRKCSLKLRNEDLNTPISNGAWYYLSDECIIGWHRDWEKLFNKQNSTDGQNYQ